MQQALQVTRNNRMSPAPMKAHIYSAGSDGGPLGVGVGVRCMYYEAGTFSMLLKVSDALQGQFQPPNQDDGELLRFIGAMLFWGSTGHDADLCAWYTVIVYHTANQFVVDTIRSWINGQFPPSNSPVTRKLMSVAFALLTEFSTRGWELEVQQLGPLKARVQANMLRTAHRLAYCACHANPPQHLRTDLRHYRLRYLVTLTDLQPLPNNQLPAGFNRFIQSIVEHTDNSFAYPTELGLLFSDRLYSFDCEPASGSSTAGYGYPPGYQWPYGDDRPWPETPTTITPIQWVDLAPAAP